MKILWVKSDFLHPTSRGGQIRTLETLKRLHARHEVHYVAYATDEEGVQRAREYASFVYPIRRSIATRRSLRFLFQLAASVFSNAPLAVSRYTSADMKAAIEDIRGKVQFDAVVCDFLTPAPNFSSLSDCVLFQHNVETIIWQRHAQHAANPLAKWYFNRQAALMFETEKRACTEARRVIAVSETDAGLMRSMFGVNHVTATPTGVDTGYFKPQPAAGAADLIFVGSMDWLPNIDGVEYFIREILPLIRAAQPDCSVAIIGRAPGKALRALAEQSGLTVTGTVPDVRPYMWGAKVSIVPLRIGGGTRLKIYEAMAAKIAVVSTSIGAEGLDVNDGENILLADTPEDFAKSCLLLLGREDERRRLADAAAAMVSARFSWETVTDQFESALVASRPGG